MAKFLLFLMPTRWLLNAIVEESHQKRGSAANHKHPSPSVVSADEEIGDGSQEEAEVVAGVHQTRTHLAAFLRPFFGNERRPDGPLSTDAHAREQSKNHEAPDIVGESAKEAEEREPDYGQHQHSRAAKPVLN